MKNLIAGYRTIAGLKQKDMARLMGISRQAYWNKEVGRTKFSDKEKTIFLSEVRKYIPNISYEDIFFNQKVGK